MSIDIANWLRGLGLEQYATVFLDNDIDSDILPELTAEDIAGLGVTSIGHRRKLLSAITALGKSASVIVPTPELEELPPPAGPQVERRQLTIMFCDLVASTELATRIDPEDLRDIIGAYHTRVSEVITRYSGFAARLMGDGVLAYFGYPQAHEDDAERAVRASLAIVDAIAAIGLAHPLQVRIGIATGLVVVGDLIGEGAAQEQTVVGDTPNLAARLQTVAAPNTVIIADRTRRQLGNLFQLHDMGPLTLKGFTGDQRAWRVAGESGEASRFIALRTPEAPLIGRAEELDLLRRRWGQAKTGEGRVVLLSAEAGVGKSRLAEAAIAEAAADQPGRLRYFCSPHHQESALFPVIDQLERAAGFIREDPLSVRQGKLAGLLADSGTTAEDMAVLAELLSLPVAHNSGDPDVQPHRKKDLTFEALMRQLEMQAHRRPVLMVIEDLHWVDPTTLELLDRAIEAIERLPVLLIATFRPEFPAPWMGQPHVTMLALSRLGRRDGIALVQHLVRSIAALPAATVEEIIERSDGIPLFIEEVTKVVLENAGSSAAMGAGAVPPTLQASLMARLDRLGTTARETAQVGAAIGRDFPYDLLVAAAARGEGETRPAIDRLVVAELVFQRGTPPTADYQFKHALVQDVAYGTLLRGPRQALHGRIAAALRERDRDHVERSPEILAHHLTQAGAFDEAAFYWLEAGQHASSRSANIEAAAHLEHGIAGLSRLEETPERMQQELRLQLALGPALLSTRGYGVPEVRSAYQRAAELADRLGDDRARFAASWGLWITTRLGDEEDVERLHHLDKLVEISGRLEDAELSLQAHHSAWATWIWSGDYVRSQNHIREGIALYDPDRHRHHALLYGGHDPGVCGHGQSAVALWALGFPDQAKQHAHEAVLLAERLGHVPSLVHALWFAAAVAHLRRDLVAARECAERLLTLGREHGLRQHAAIGGIFRGWALTQTGAGAEGLAELRAHVEFYGANTWTMLALFRTVLAEAELHAGNDEQAETALAGLDQVGNRWWQAELLRLRGDLRKRVPTSGPEEAERSYREAIDVARLQQAKSLELRATTHLARVLNEAKRRDEALFLLSPLCAWFTEGLDTPDFVQAKALLDSLR